MSNWTEKEIAKREEFLKKLCEEIRSSSKLIVGTIGFLVASDGTVGVGFFNTCREHLDCYLPVIQAGVELLEAKETNSPIVAERFFDEDHDKGLN